MKTRRLGRSGPTVSALGLGCMGMSQSYGVPDPSESIATLERALEIGINFFDTADIYGPYTNEELVGRFLRSRRDRVVLATKCGFVPGVDTGPNRIDGSPDHIRAACDASLGRLGVRTIDLYYLHRVDPRTPIEASVGAMAQLVKEGKVRYLGLSEVSPRTLRRAHAVHPITAVQSEYSLWTRDPEDGILPACRELGVGFVPFSPLGRGALSGRVRTLEGLPADDFRRAVPRFQKENLDQNLVGVDRLAAFAAQRGATPAQLALAWLLAQGPDIVPIPGTKRRSYLEENAAAVDLELSRSDLDRIEAAIPRSSVTGARYSPASFAMVDRS
jgi:aryl-alcohol dehydrogenase-like predicted oxidoreductase